MAEIVGGVIAAAVPLANFVLQLKSKMERHTPLADRHKALNEGLERLLALLKDKEREVSSNVILKDTTNAYQLWKNRVSNIENEVPSLNTKYELRAKKWFFGKNSGLKKEIKRALGDVIKLLDEECPKKILVDKLPERVIKEIGVPSVVEYPTLQKAFQDIQALLEINGVKCVALRGQKGVGKTTIMQNLNNHHFNDNSPDKEFDMVIFIKMTDDEQTKDLYILQKIADRMGVDREGDELQVAGRIQRVLKDKRYLLILDGVRHPIDGIWKNLDISKGKRDGKVVITTCYPLAWKSACVQRVVELKKLSPTEEWLMFRDIVGDNLLPDIPNARLVCKKFCCCLPLLIHPIARFFKYQESPTDWGTPFPQDGVDGLKEIYSILKICYERLGDERKQKCFLYASLHPANRNIYTHYLVECYIVQGFLGDVDADTKYSEMRSRAKDVMRHLVNVAFLEEGEQMRYVKMTDLYRQLALYISSKDPNSESRIYVDDEEHKEAFRSTSWKDAKWVSMVDSKRDSLPTSQNYGSLQTLLLQKNLRLVEIPTTYFDSMGNLLVLNLNGTKIRRLPSLLRLTSLKAFYLNDCSDLVLSPSDIQTLQHLEVFDIRGTRVDFVPCLEHLKCLRFSYTASISDCCHIISTLDNLEELNIEVERQFQKQWSNDVKDHIEQFTAQRNLSFICDLK